MYAKLSEGAGNKVSLTFDGKPRDVTVSGAVAWDAGHVSAKAFRKQPGVAVELPDIGDFEREQGFSYGAWVKVPKVPSGAIFARMDDQHDFRGWDLWLQNGRIGTHIINKWPNDALKVVSKNPVKPGQWTHVFVTYDGSGRGEGVRVYINGVSQETEFEANALRSTIRTTVPLKIGQRHSTSPLDGLDLQDVRIYGRTLPPVEVQRLAKATRAAGSPRSQPPRGRPARRMSCSTGGSSDWMSGSRGLPIS